MGGYPYVFHNNKIPLYGPKDMTNNEFEQFCKNMRQEQDMRSPHCYIQNETRRPHEGAVIAEIGAAEASFSLSVVDTARYVYLFECDEKWMIPLQKTFEPWNDKVSIVKKFVGKKTEGEFVSLDDFFKGKDIDVVKADIEGYEVDMLEGGEQTFKNKVKQAYLCAYHRWNDEEVIKDYLEKFGFDVSVNTRYMLMHYNPWDFKKRYLRRGVAYGERLQISEVQGRW